MHVNLFDRFIEKESIIHRLDPRVKVITLVGFILSNALLPDGAWLAFIVGWIFLLFANDLSKLGLSYTFRRSIIALPFALAAVSAIFSPMGNPLATWHFGMFTLTPTDLGVLRFTSILIRSWLSVQMGILLVATTPFPDLIHALEHLHFPKSLSTIIAFLYRYLFVLTDETFRLLRARDARSAGLEGTKAGGALFWRMRVAGNMAGQLFVRSYDRSDRIYSAMLSRGYTGNIRTLNPHTMKQSDWAIASTIAVFLIVTQMIGWIR